MYASNRVTQYQLNVRNKKYSLVGEQQIKRKSSLDLWIWSSGCWVHCFLELGETKFQYYCRIFVFVGGQKKT